MMHDAFIITYLKKATSVQMWPFNFFIVNPNLVYKSLHHRYKTPTINPELIRGFVGFKFDSQQVFLWFLKMNKYSCVQQTVTKFLQYLYRQ